MKAKMNIWVRDRTCALVKGRSHLHIYDCHHRPVLEYIWFTGGHVEVDVPPGCYLVVVGTPGGNIYTDLAMVIVRCGDDACVNLVLNDYKRIQAFPGETPSKPNLVLLGGCGARILVPFLVHAKEAGIRPDEIKATFDVLTRAAGLDKKSVIGDIKSHISEVEKFIKNAPPKEKEDLEPLKAHIKLLKEHPLVKD
ncbi:MAG: hypothetical protein M0Q91_14195 [Methanoregula sp.]|jgi:hypothetical protein|nr:hypothetical protein [Methanoregula sp.]